MLVQSVWCNRTLNTYWVSSLWSIRWETVRHRACSTIGLLYYFTNLPNLWFVVGKPKVRRQIPLHSIIKGWRQGVISIVTLRWWCRKSYPADRLQVIHPGCCRPAMTFTVTWALHNWNDSYSSKSQQLRKTCEGKIWYACNTISRPLHKDGWFATGIHL